MMKIFLTWLLLSISPLGQAADKPRPADVARQWYEAFNSKDPSIIDALGLRITPGVSPKLLFHRDPKWHHPLS